MLKPAASIRRRCFAISTFDRDDDSCRGVGRRGFRRSSPSPRRLSRVSRRRRGSSRSPLITACGRIRRAKRPGSIISARARNIAHRVVGWEGAKPDTGLPAAAREARYRLLSAAAKAGESDLVLTGHTLDDQVETHCHAPPAAASSGRGLAGMARATLFDRATWIVRPLLGVVPRRSAQLSPGAQHSLDRGPDQRRLNYERVRVRRCGHSQRGRTGGREIGTAQTARRANAVKAARFVSELTSGLGPKARSAVDSRALQAFDEDSAVALRPCGIDVGRRRAGAFPYGQ